MGQGSHLNSAKEKRFPFGQQVSFLWERGRSVGAHSNPLSYNLGTVD